MFEQNALSYARENKAGMCPLCGKPIVVDIIKNKRRDNIHFSCPNCKKTEMYSCKLNLKSGD